jgi:hypothetical protein
VKSIELPVVFADYTVKFTAKYPEVDGRTVNGYCDYTKREIAVYANPTNPELLRATLWHEFFHAAFRELGRSGLADDEALVDGLANALMRVRLAHPKL